MAPKSVGFVVYPGFVALDVIGPLEAFDTARVGKPGSDERGYETLVIGPSRGVVASESGVVLKPRRTLEDAPPLDTLIVPGGAGLRVPQTLKRVASWIRLRATRTRRVASVCTGLYGLAATGLLDGCAATTHWRFAADVAERYPRIRIDPNPLYVKDGKFYTSAGVTAGIDLALAMIEEDYGAAIALRVARELVVYLKRPGGQEQYSEPLRFQTHAVDRFATLVPWLLENLTGDLSLTVLADRVCLSPRQFARRFKQAFGQTPATFVLDRRLDEARRRLSSRSESIENVAASVGFTTPDGFRRAFERRFRISPSLYRGRFETGQPFTEPAAS
jgi:transcriptional regulator GlxA family with amidase domain